MRAITMAVLVAALTTASSAALAQDCRCPQRATDALELGVLQHPALTEASGLAVSRLNDDVLWTHNDSGDVPRLFAASHAGRHLGVFALAGAQAVDWEDVALGPCPAAASCLYVADVGDNEVSRSELVLYRVAEPRVDALANTPVAVTLAGVEAFVLTWPLGEAADAETLLVNPSDGAVYLVTKVESGKSRLYRVPLDGAQPGGPPLILERLAEATLGRIAQVDQATTGGAFAPDGRRFVVRTRTHLHEFAVPDGTDDVAAAFVSPPISTRVEGEAQGEGVSYAPDGVTLWTTSEGARSPLRAYGCVVALPAGCAALDPEAVEVLDEAAPGGSSGGCCAVVPREVAPERGLPAVLLGLALLWLRRRGRRRST